jgi:streptogramin lyase
VTRPGLLLIAAATSAAAFGAARQSVSFSSSSVLAQLPEGQTKRQFIIDCTNCHQLDAEHAYPDGKPRSVEAWTEIVKRMIGYAGDTTGFPIMSVGRDAEATAVWLARHLRQAPAAEATLDSSIADVVPNPDVVEYPLPEPRDLPHDIAVDSAGRVVVTGMLTSAMYILDTASGAFTAVPITIANANPRAVEVAPNGDWWVLLGAPNLLARYQPDTQQWREWNVFMYGHSIAIDRGNRVWFNGHFTRDPELIGYVDPATDSVRTFAVPRHVGLATRPGGPIPYELRVAPAGNVWISELQGNRMIWFRPGDSLSGTFELPTPTSGPRRFEIDSAGTLWIPTYAANTLVRFDPSTGRHAEYPLPRKDAAPYVARVSGTSVWIGTGASDEVYRFDMRTGRFQVYPLPSRGAVIRHIVISPRTGDVWLAYGASPGIAARIARLRPAAVKAHRRSE